MDKLKVEEGREWAQIEEENSKGIHSTFNACMFRGECRSKDAEIAELKRQLEGERAAALNYRNDAIEAGKKCDGLLAALERAETAMEICSDWMAEIEMPEGWTMTTDEKLRISAAIEQAKGA